MRLKFLILTTAALLAASTAARAQSQIAEEKFEIGGFFTAVNLEGFEEMARGVGMRFGYNFNDRFALDAEGSVLPSGRFGNSRAGRAQGFVGIKAGGRSKYVGLFAKARPGVMVLGDVTSGFDCERANFGQVCRPEHGQFAFDAGGVLEVYPSSKAIVRVDVGDTMVRLRTVSGGILGGRQSSTELTHNFQASIGFGYRF